MSPLAPFWTSTTLLELQLLLATFVLCSLVGIERELRQKSAGYRTNVLVGMGACAFTLVSGHGFAMVLGDDVRMDASRIAAQVVSGIGFLGAGVIFKGRDVVRGLTTAATVWVSAAIGMACGSGMLSLAVILTVLHLVTLFLVAPLVRRLPRPDRHRRVRVTYRDGEGVLRDVLTAATQLGFASLVQGTHRERDGEVVVSLRFTGRRPLDHLVGTVAELPGVIDVAVHGSDLDDELDAE